MQFTLRTFMQDRPAVNLNRPDSIHLADLPFEHDTQLRGVFQHAEDVFDSIAHRKVWVVKSSGGKDSSLTLALAVEYLLRRPEIRPQVYVIRNDTLMELPQLTDFAHRLVEYAHALCTERGIALHEIVTKPEMDDRYWVMALGHGYPPFNRQFRPCTTRMKITPSEAVMKRLLDDLGTDGNDMAVLLGVRRAESADRAERYKDAPSGDSCLRGEGECGSVTVDGLAFTADLQERGIVDVYPVLPATTGNVWDALFWLLPTLGWPTKELADIYGDEHTRFGCWKCPLVQRVRDVEMLLQTPGNEWLDNLLSFRADYLSEAQQDENRLHIVHAEERLTRTGRVRKAGAQKTGLTPAFRERWLERLTTLDAEVNATTGYHLIEPEEVEYIRWLWERERLTGKRGKGGRGRGA